MTRYRNQKTGTVIETESKVSGADWVEIAKEAPAKQEKAVKVTKKAGKK